LTQQQGGTRIDRGNRVGVGSIHGAREGREREEFYPSSGRWKSNKTCRRRKKRAKRRRGENVLVNFETVQRGKKVTAREEGVYHKEYVKDPQRKEKKQRNTRGTSTMLNGQKSKEGVEVINGAQEVQGRGAGTHFAGCPSCHKVVDRGQIVLVGKGAEGNDKNQKGRVGCPTGEGSARGKQQTVSHSESYEGIKEKG